jgi:hypothetical protein
MAALLLLLALAPTLASLALGMMKIPFTTPHRFVHKVFC